LQGLSDSPQYVFGEFSGACFFGDNLQAFLIIPAFAGYVAKDSLKRNVPPNVSFCLN